MSEAVQQPSDDLRRALAARGVVWTTYRGLALPAHFGDPAREWRAGREGAAVAVAFRRLVVATGDDRVEFLQGMLSNDVKALSPGGGMYAASLTQQGRVVSDLRIYAEADRLLLDVVAWQMPTLLAHLGRFIVADDVELADAVDEQPLLAVEGPLAAAVVAEALGVATLPGEPLAHATAIFEGKAVRVIVASECDGPGILLCGPAAAAAPLFDACREAGAQPLGLTALDALRVEAGVPWPAVDMGEDVLWMETGRAQALSFSKGCYLGQEVVERIEARGHVNRRLAGLIVAGDAPPAARAAVLADGREVGYVTSGARAQAVGTPIALAMMQRNHLTAGESVEVRSDAAVLAATVAALPFDPDIIAVGGR